MTHRPTNSRLDALLQRCTPGPGQAGNTKLHWICIPAAAFAVLGLLFAINFGLSLIAVAFAIVYYSRFGERIAASLGAALLGMLAVWMLLMPSHHLVAAALAILAAALAGQFAAPRRSRPARLGWLGRDLLDAPVYALVKLRERLAFRRRLAETPVIVTNFES